MAFSARGRFSVTSATPLSQRYSTGSSGAPGTAAPVALASAAADPAAAAPAALVPASVAGSGFIGNPRKIRQMYNLHQKDTRAAAAGPGPGCAGYSGWLLGQQHRGRPLVGGE